MILSLGVLVLFLWSIFSLFSTAGNKVSYSQVLDLFQNQQVKSFVVSGKQIRLELHAPYNGETSISTGLSDPEQFRQEMWDTIQEQHSAGILESYDFVAEKEPTAYSLILPLLIVGLILLILVAIVCAIVLNKTRPGRYMICLGANREAVRLSGVDTRRWEMLAYIISGALAGLAAIFFVGCYTTVQPGRGDTFNNEAIAACVMGGTSMAGGLASILGTVIGAFIIAIMQEGILSMGLNISYQYALTGLIVLGAVIADTLSRRRKN
jgi:ABC-type glucose/galactose transport system permease subunit